MSYSAAIARRDELETARLKAWDEYRKQLNEQNQLLIDKVDETALFILNHHMAINSWNERFDTEWGEITVIKQHIHHWSYNDLVKHCGKPRIEGFGDDARAVWSIYNREFCYEDEHFSFSLKLIENDDWRDEFAAIHQSALTAKKAKQREADLAELNRLKARLGAEHV